MSVRSMSLSFVSVICLASSTQAAPSTSHGQISVPQVIEMLDKSPSDRLAEQVLTAYLAGVGEAAGVAINGRGTSCASRLNLTADNVRQAISAAAGRSDAAQVPATPLIVRDMLNRARCTH